MINEDLKEGGIIYRVEDNLIQAYKVKSVKIDGVLVTARIDCERGRFQSNLVAGNKFGHTLSGDRYAFYVDFDKAKREYLKLKERSNVYWFLHHLRAFGINATIQTTDLIERIKVEYNPKDFDKCYK